MDSLGQSSQSVLTNDERYVFPWQQPSGWPSGSSFVLPNVRDDFAPGSNRSVTLAINFRSVFELGANQSTSSAPDWTVYETLHLDNVVGRRLSPGTLVDVLQILGRLLHRLYGLGISVEHVELR